METLGRYILTEKIASGGMADVYRGKLVGVEGFEKEIALKKILPHWNLNQDFITMLVDEAKVLLHLTHSNIVQVFELNREEELYFIAMEYVDGIDLRTLLKKIKELGVTLPVEIACWIAQEVLKGLQHAHEKRDRSQKPLQIVHRDISPQNILLSFDGEVKITDFGIAKVLGKTSETITGTLKGKFAYMSPEQALGQKVDARTDLFAVGILLFEMLTGERCFKGRNDLDTLEVVRQAQVVFPENFESPEQLRFILSKALQKNREDRYPSAQDFYQDLRSFEMMNNLNPSVQHLSSFLTKIFPHKKSETIGNRLLTENKQKIIPTETQRKTRILESFETVLAKEPEERIHTLSNNNEETLVGRNDSSSLQKKNLESVVNLHHTPSPVLLTKKQKKIPIKSILFLCLILLLFFWNRNFSTPPQKIESLAAFGNFSTLTSKSLLFLSGGEALSDKPASPEITLVEKNIVNPVKTPGRTGTLSVIARPWGRVFISGITSGAETPFSKNNVPVGNYSVRVSYPPQGKTVSTSVKIVEKSSIRCQASFGEKATIRCR